MGKCTLSLSSLHLPAVGSTELNENDGNLQVESESVKLGDASFIKFKIVSGWNDFVALHRVSVEGSTSRR